MGLQQRRVTILLANGPHVTIAPVVSKDPKNEIG